MRKFIFTIIIAAICMFANAQTYPLAIRMDLVTWITLEPENAPDTDNVGTLNIVVKSYDVYQLSSGQFYINFTNSQLKQNRKYLGYTHGYNQTYEGNTVFLNADTTKAWIWTTDRYGQIYKMDMPDFFATDLKKIK